MDNVPLQELNKTFTQAPNSSVRLSDIKPTEGPSVKYLKETDTTKSTVKSSATKRTIKIGSTTEIARIIKTGIHPQAHPILDYPKGNFKLS